MNISRCRSLIAVGFTLCITAQSVNAETLRLLTWGGYAPKIVVDMFKAETGIDVEVTKSNNEDMIAKLSATRGGGFDLVQPSQDRIASAHAEFNIYKPIDMSQIDNKLFVASMLDATLKSSMYEGKSYGVPHIWGTSGLIVNSEQAANVKDYTDLCNDTYRGKVTYRLKRPTLIAFAFSMGLDPFAAYDDPAEYEKIMLQVQDKLISCKANVKAYWSGGDAMKNLMRSNETVAAMAWDAGGWQLNDDNKAISFVAPTSGALGWIDAFAIPRKSKNESAAYKWINFVMQPKVAAMITDSAGNFTASKGADDFVNASLRAKYKASFDTAAIDNIKWYPPVPAGLEMIEGKVLDRIKAAK
ncbi:spermidine/putrescine ABC transporter substrate-binding protein [Psychromonas marina]|uniref:Spermidine/putrescine ABC transporter substrate-binding protein n=1 Tax=Psychromonas marina TaxID=88364 RepID=A0ABQ6DW15_9GAMM|nr:extracellular solute-binding protein [Psychromonas marina]GLS89313.1 spermidine/putrescine ABC transporter substrate-binding protein [Psychromonas marina]